MLRKANAHSVVVCKLIKINHVNEKKIQGENLIQTFIYPKLPSACEVLLRRNAMLGIYLFTPKVAEIGR